MLCCTAMKRRKFMMGAAGIGCGVLVAPMASRLCAQRTGEKEISPVYAESAAIFGVSADGTEEFSMRVGRFPARDAATLWATVSLGGRVHSVSLTNLQLGDFKGVTPVEDDHAEFEIGGEAKASLERTRSESGMFGSARAEVRAHGSAHPPPGIGSEPLLIDARFEAWHRPVMVRPGRMEVMGEVDGLIRTPRGEQQLRILGGWHEQVGDRPRFAPAFTYFKVFGDRMGLLALRRASGAWGFALAGGEVTGVKEFTIDPIGPSRKFQVTLENGKRIAGEAVRLRETSVPIEGRRRPGTTVRVSSDMGPMIGRLNDWDPGED